MRSTRWNLKLCHYPSPAGSDMTYHHPCFLGGNRNIDHQQGSRGLLLKGTGFFLLVYRQIIISLTYLSRSEFPQRFGVVTLLIEI